MGREKIRNEEGSKPKVSRRGKRVKHEQIKEKKRQKNFDCYFNCERQNPKEEERSETRCY